MVMSKQHCSIRHGFLPLQQCSWWNRTVTLCTAVVYILLIIKHVQFVDAQSPVSVPVRVVGTASSDFSSMISNDKEASIKQTYSVPITPKVLVDHSTDLDDETIIIQQQKNKDTTGIKSATVSKSLTSIRKLKDCNEQEDDDDSDIDVKKSDNSGSGNSDSDNSDNEVEDSDASDSDIEDGDNCPAPTAPVTTTTVTAPTTPVTTATTVTAPTTPTTPIASDSEYDCTFTSPAYSIGSSGGTATIRAIVHPVKSTITVEMTYAGLGYVAFGFSNTGKMNPAIVALGLPDDSQTTLKYSISSYSQDGIQPVSAGGSSYGTVSQNTTHTVLMFTRPFLEDSVGTAGVTDVVPTSDNVFIWAIGGSNTLSFHSKFGSDTLPVSSIGTCAPISVSVPTASVPTQPAPVNAVPVAAPVNTVPEAAPVNAVPVAAPVATNTTTDTSTGSAPTAPSTTNTGSAPTAPTITTTNSTTPASDNTEYDCTFASPSYSVVNSDGTVSIRAIVHPTKNTITVEMTYVGLGYLAFGFSSTGKMNPAIVALGLPDDSQPTLKYSISSYSQDGIVPVTADSTTSSTYGTISQNGTHTVLVFTRPVLEDSVGTDGATDVVATSDNVFIWAIGGSNALSFHSKYGSDTLPVSSIGTCVLGSGAATPTSVAAPTSSVAAPSPTVPVNSVPVGATAPTATTTSTISQKANSTSSTSTASAVLGKMLYENLYLKLVPSTDQKYIEVEVTHAHNGVKNGFIALGVSSTGKMAPAIAVIGSSDNSMPMMYDLTSYSEVTMLPSSQQTLEDASYETNNTHSVLKYRQLITAASDVPKYRQLITGVGEVPKYRQLITDAGELPMLINQDTTFIYAIGTLPSIDGGHGQQRGEFTCNPAGGTCSTGEVKAQKSRKSAWLIHGILMVLAWIILVPTAIGASLLRRLLPVGPLWFKIHKGANLTGILFTIVGFIISVITVAQEGKTHFTTNSHYKAGLAIFLIALFQALNGIFKPPAPPAPTPEQLPTKEKETVSHERSIENGSADDLPVQESASQPEQVQKSVARVSWEIYHRIFGFALLGISWYNCNTGAKLFAQRYDANYTTALWIIIGVMCSLLTILYTYAKTKK